MSISKQESQRLLERVSKLEGQVASLQFKLQNFEKILRPEELMRRVKEGIAEEKRKAEAKAMLSGAELLAPKSPPTT